MKYISLFISILILCNFKAFSQESENQIKKDTMLTSEYLNYGIKINFKGSIDIIKNNFEEAQPYFYKSIEIIRFNENKINYQGQHLIPQVQSLINPRNYPIDTTQEESSSIDNDIPNVKAYSSLSNPFYYNIHFSSLYILPKMSIEKLKTEIVSYADSDSLYQITQKVEPIKIGENKGYKWRLQNGKTRLDHYMFFGKEHNYLFVSSPYGSNGSIETAVLEMELL